MNNLVKWCLLWKSTGVLTDSNFSPESLPWHLIMPLLSINSLIWEKRGFLTFLSELRISNSLAKDFLYIIFIAKISALIYYSFRNVFWNFHFSTTFCIHYRSEKTYEEYQLFFIGVHAPVGGHIALWLIMIANFSLYF